jgi:hypothetical protein
MRSVALKARSITSAPLPINTIHLVELANGHSNRVRDYSFAYDKTAQLTDAVM